jgi:hypothetical protein
MCRSRSIKAIDVFVGFLDLFRPEHVQEKVWVQKCDIYFYMHVSCFLVNRNAIIGMFIFMA